MTQKVLNKVEQILFHFPGLDHIKVIGSEEKYLSWFFVVVLNISEKVHLIGWKVIKILTIGNIFLKIFI